MVHSHPFPGANQTDDLLPNWYYDILIVEMCQPYLPSLIDGFTGLFGQTVNSYFWDLLPEIFSGKKLRSNPGNWLPFLQNEQIGLANLELNTSAQNPFPSLHAHYLNHNQQETSEHAEWNTDVILKIISENKISAVFIVNKECSLPIEPEIEKIRTAALLNEIYFGRLDSPSIPVELLPSERALYYTSLFSSWFESLSPVIKVRVR